MSDALRKMQKVGYAKSFDSSQPVQTTQTDINRNFYAICTLTAWPKDLQDPVNCWTQWILFYGPCLAWLASSVELRT